ncbi:hypothetical protein Tco_1174225 [Tanacetum coccineum]
MLATTISWFLVCEVSETFKDMIEHEIHFIPYFMDEGLSVLAIGTSVHVMVELMMVNQSIKIDQVKEGFILHVIVDWRSWLEICSKVRSGGGFVHLGGKSARLLSSWIGEDSFEEISMTFVLAIFLGGDEEDDASLRNFGCFGCPNLNKVLHSIFQSGLWAIWNWRNKVVHAPPKFRANTLDEDLKVIEALEFYVLQASTL